jgi:hypothetical protein
MAAAMLALPQNATPAAKPHMLPERLLRCSLGRVTNFDPAARQTYADLRFEGSHRFELALPAVPVRTGPPPEAPLPPEPVDPHTRILADPDNLTRGAPPRFDRVVDYWPDRVELTTVISDPLNNLIIITPIDPARGTARLMMTHATDISSLDFAHLYQGDCTVTYPGLRV